MPRPLGKRKTPQRPPAPSHAAGPRPQCASNGLAVEPTERQRIIQMGDAGMGPKAISLALGGRSRKTIAKILAQARDRTIGLAYEARRRGDWPERRDAWFDPLAIALRRELRASNP